MYFSISSPARTAFGSLASRLIGETLLYIFFGVQYNPLACESESKGNAAIDAHLNSVFLAGESLFTMMLVLSSAATSRDTLFGGIILAGPGSGWLVFWNAGISWSGGEVISVFGKLAASCESGVCTCWVVTGLWGALFAGSS